MSDDYHKLLEQIADQAMLTRQRQKEYYNPKTRTQSGLLNAKKAENVLDILLGRLAQMRAEQKTDAPHYEQAALP